MKATIFLHIKLGWSLTYWYIFCKNPNQRNYSNWWSIFVVCWINALWGSYLSCPLKALSEKLRHVFQLRTFRIIKKVFKGSYFIIGWFNSNFYIPTQQQDRLGDLVNDQSRKKSYWREFWKGREKKASNNIKNRVVG